MDKLHCLDWSGQAFTLRQKVVVQAAAIKYLREKRKTPTIHFSHPDCEGVLRRLKEGVFGSIGGTFFKADLGSVNGKPHTLDFLIRRGVEKLSIRDGGTVVFSRFIKLESGESDVVEQKIKAPKFDSVKLNSLN